MPGGLADADEGLAEENDDDEEEEEDDGGDDQPADFEEIKL